MTYFSCPSGQKFYFNYKIVIFFFSVNLHTESFKWGNVMLRVKSAKNIYDGS